MCQLIAEIGGNHEGDIAYAKKLVKLAASSKAQIIKTQAYTGDSLVNPRYDPKRNTHFKRFELTLQQNLDLAELVKASGKKFSVSVWNIDWVEDFLPFVDYYKVGSGDMTNYPMLSKLASTSKPIILSTGISSFEEVKSAVQYLRSRNAAYNEEDNLVVLQCTSMYPIGWEDANLGVMQAYREEFRTTIGYSDHTIGNEALCYAKTLGADFLEFHFTDDKSREFRDHHISLTHEEVNALHDKLESIDQLIGDGIKRPMSIELENNHHYSFRRGLYASTDLYPGRVVVESDLEALRPCEGLGAENIHDVVGRKLLRKKGKGDKFGWDDFEK